MYAWRSWSISTHGWWVLDGWLTPEDGALLHAALEVCVDGQLRAQRNGDPTVGLVASQQRASALVDLAAQAMRQEPSGESVPDRYRVGVVVTAHQRDEIGAAGCDSAMCRIVVGADSEVLDIGRQVRRWPRGIRRAITHRDGGCLFPGCDRPPSWCDVHHCTPWEDGGRTSIDNGALLYRRHHTFIHKQRWRTIIEHGRPIILRDNVSRPVIDRWRAA